MQTPEELLLAARESSLRGEHQQALDLCISALQRKPGDPQAVAFLGLCLWRSGNFGQAADVLKEALRRFPAQPELSQALLESLHNLGEEGQALSFAATLPVGLLDKAPLRARVEALQASAAGLRPSPAVTAQMLKLHEEGNFEALETRVGAVLRRYPHWSFGQTLLASCQFMSSGRALTAQCLSIASAAAPAAQVRSEVRQRLRGAMSAARSVVLQQIDIAISGNPGDRHAKELRIRTLFEEGDRVNEDDLAHIAAQVQGQLIGPCALESVADEDLRPQSVDVRRIEPPRVIEIPAPRSVGPRALELAGAIGPALLNARYVGEARGATVCAGSDVILLPNGGVLCDNLTHPLGELVNYHFDAWIVMGSVSQLVLRELPTESLAGTTISLLGAATKHYGHWLLDTLVRLRSLEEHPAASTACLLVDSDMPETHIEALELLLGPGRTIHRLPRGRCVVAERLLFTGPEVFFPNVLRHGAPSVASVAPSAAVGFAYLRERMHAALGGKRVHGGRRLLVRRRSSTRRVVNEDALCRMLVSDWGFEELHPEVLQFAEQVERFRDADVIVGAQGSAMSNCVFCTPGARVVSLCSTFAANFPSWADALERLGVQHCFVVGEAVAESHVLAIQRDIRVEPDKVLEALARLGVARAA